ncbi:MAG: hypothetical protein F4103_06655 [Boseongicola sp. SB0673_bin_14]|nr:hypothetical protein [Chloroflexota bacterium]MYI68425.1 hypothetical protein [Boseongicola sp. SB0673_bin_14]
MAYQFSKEIEEQQALVKREIAKLAKMRTDHLISTGQMPTKEDLAAYLKENNIAVKPAPGDQEITPS